MGKLSMKKIVKKIEKFIDKHHKIIAFTMCIVFGAIGMYWGYIK